MDVINDTSCNAHVSTMWWVNHNHVHAQSSQLFNAMITAIFNGTRFFSLRSTLNCFVGCKMKRVFICGYNTSCHQPHSKLWQKKRFVLFERKLLWYAMKKTPLQMNILNTTDDNWIFNSVFNQMSFDSFQFLAISRMWFSLSRW